MSDADAWAQMAALNAGASAQASAAAAENLAHNLGNIIIPGQLGYQAATAYEQTAQQYPGVASQVEAAASRAAAEKAAADQAAQQQAQQAAETQRLTTIQSAQRASTQSSIQEQFNYALQNAKWAPASYLQPILQSAVGAGVPDAWKLVAASPALSEIAGLSFGTLTKTNFGGYEITPSAESSRRYISDVVAPAAKKAAIIESIVPGVAMTEEQKEAIGYYGPYTGELISVTEPETKQAPTGKTYYVPYGERTQTEIKDISAVRYGETGEVGFYQSLYTPEGKLRNITNLVSSGGAAALQSGMFSEKPMTVDIRTQEQPEKYAASAIPAYAEMVKASPESFSRLGAEAYGGYVLPLDTSRTIESTGAQLSTYGEAAKNLASLVSPQGSNLPRSEYVSLPWGEAVAPGTGVKRLGAEGLEIRDFAAPSQFAGVGPTVVMRTQRGVGGADYGLATPYVPSESVMLPQRTTIDVGTIPIVGMFAAPVAGALGLKTDIEAGAFGAFVNPPMRETTKAGKPIAIPEVTVPGETYISKTPTGYEVVSTETKYGGEVTPYVTTQEVAGRSGYEQFKQNIRDVLKLPTPEVGEKVVQLTALALPVISTLTLPSVIAEAKGDKEAARYTGIIEPLRGQYTQFYEEPLLTPISAGIGAGFGVLSKGVESAYIGSRALAAEKIISEGGAYRTAERLGSAVVSRLPTALGAIYGADVLSRSTEGFKSYEPSEVATRARGIVIQEAAPMAIGFGLPEAATRATRISDIGYKSALQEGATTGRLQYYVTEPISRPIELAKIDYRSFSQEAAPKEVGATDYLASKISTQARSGEISVKSFVQESKESAAKAISSVSDRLSNVASRAGEITSGERAITLEKTFGGGKQPPITPEYSRAYIAPEDEYVFAYPESAGVGKQIGLANIAVKSFIQEGGISKGLSALGKVGRTTYGETPVIFAGVSTPSKEPGAQPITKGKPPEGGAGGRVSREKIVGGRVVSGLAIESSLKSLGITEKPSGAIGKQTFQRADYRGKPVSERMKPMDLSTTKQASGQRLTLLTEELPTVEGMTQGKVSPRSQVGIPFITPRMELGRIITSEISKRGLILESIQTQRVDQVQTVEQARKQRDEVMQSLKVKTSLGHRTMQDQMREQARGLEISQIQSPSLKTDVGTASKVTQKQTITQTTVPTRVAIPRETTITTPRITTPPRKTTLKVPGIPPTVPYGGAGAGARGERGRRFTKELRVGTGIGWIDIAGTQRRQRKK